MLFYLAISASSGSKPGAAIARGDLKTPSKIRPPDILRTYDPLHFNKYVNIIYTNQLTINFGDITHKR